MTLAVPPLVMSDFDVGGTVDSDTTLDGDGVPICSSTGVFYAVSPPRDYTARHSQKQVSILRPFRNCDLILPKSGISTVCDVP